MKKLFSLFLLFLTLSSFSNSADSLKTDLKSLLQNLPKEHTDTILARKYLDVVTFYFEDLNLDSAKKYLDSGFNYANNSKSNFLVNEFNLFYNTYYLYNSNLDTAITIAWAVFENKPNLIAKATALSGIGNGYYFKGDYLNALEYYLQGLEIEEQIAPEKTNITYSNIANLYSNLGDAEKAIEYFRKCQTIEKANKDTLGLFVGLINFHNTFSKEKLYDSADVYLIKAKKWRQFIGVNFYDEVLRQHLALYNARLKNYPLAINQMDSSIQIAKDKGDMFMFCNISSHLTRTLIEVDQIKKAKKIGEEALKIAVQEKIYSSQRFLNKHLSKIAEIEGNYKQSLTYYKNFKQLEDSFFNVQKAGSINRLKFLREKQEKESLETKAEISIGEAALKEKEVQYQKQLTQYFLIGVLALIVALSLVVFLYFSNQKFIKKLSESQELIKANSIELESYNERLIEINNIKNKLLSLLAHDLRSPLVGIVSSMNLIKEDEFTKEETDEILQEIYNSALSNLQGLDNLVAWAKSQMEGLNIANQSFNLNTVLGELENELQNLVITKKINLVLEKEANIKIKADKEMIKSALRNLLTNAIKFSNQKQTVSLSIEDGGSIVEIKIKDEAGGIPKNIQNQIFKEPLKSVSGTRGERGSGIGLLLVKEFVNLNGGDIQFESIENVGTTFTLTLNKAL